MFLATMHESIIKPSEIAVIELSYLSTARFTGNECGSFLQSQLSADIEALEPGDSTFSCFCTPKGKVLGLLMIGRLGDDYIACAHSDLLPGILARLKIFVFRTRVDFALDPDTQVFGMMGVETESATFRPGIGDLAYTFSKKTTKHITVKFEIYFFHTMPGVKIVFCKVSYLDILINTQC